MSLTLDHSSYLNVRPDVKFRSVFSTQNTYGHYFRRAFEERKPKISCINSRRSSALDSKERNTNTCPGPCSVKCNEEWTLEWCYPHLDSIEAIGYH